MNTILGIPNQFLDFSTIKECIIADVFNGFRNSKF